ncbi:MAG: ATP-binding protein [Calditrichota bacterium]
MNLARIWIDRKTGAVTQADATFEAWGGGTGTHVDEYFQLEEGGSLFAAVQARLSDHPLHSFPVAPKEPLGMTRRVLCVLDTRNLAPQAAWPVSIVPMAEAADDLARPPAQLFDAITDFLVVCDPTYTIRRANRAAQAVYGGLGALEGQPCYRVLRGKPHPCTDCPLPQTLETGKVVPYEYYDDQLREFLEMRTYPHLGGDGTLADFTILTRVVSERRRQEGETAQQKKLVALGQMASGLAHDFNNMLTIILGRVQLLKSRTTDPGLLRNLKTIEKAAFDSTDIIQRLQDFTRQREEGSEQSFAPVEVNTLVEDVVQYVQTRTDRLRKQEGIRIEVELQLREVARIEGQSAQLRSALLNVAFNAIDAMPIGGVLRLWTQQLGTQVEIGVADTGVGMSKEVREKMFDPFFTTKGERGNGLGLSEVYGIVNQHNGSIRVDSTPGEGTTITLYFPIAVSSIS